MENWNLCVKNKPYNTLYQGNLCKRKKTCAYSTNFNGVWLCNYLLATGKPRNCPADQCNKYKKQIGKRKTKENLKRSIAYAVAEMNKNDWT